MKDNHNEITLPDYILVHPALKHDPVSKQGQIGFMTSALLSADEFFVAFDDRQIGLYSADALLSLKQAEDIYDYLQENAVGMSAGELTALKSIALLLEFGTMNHSHTALELARKNENILAAATTPLAEYIGLNQNKSLKR